MIKEALFALILASSILAGYIIAYLCRDELVAGRKVFKILFFISIILAIISAFFIIYLSLALLYFAVISFFSWRKSFDKKFVKR